MATVIFLQAKGSTAQPADDRVHFATQPNSAFYAHLDRSALDRRLAELDREWNVERMIETKAGAAVFVSFVLGAVSSRKWFALSALVGFLLMQHAVHGRCLPPALLRRLGFRTAQEIEEERQELLSVRDVAQR